MYITMIRLLNGYRIYLNMSIKDYIIFLCGFYGWSDLTLWSKKSITPMWKLAAVRVTVVSRNRDVTCTKNDEIPKLSYSLCVVLEQCDIYRYSILSYLVKCWLSTMHAISIYRIIGSHLRSGNVMLCKNVGGSNSFFIV